MSELSRLLSSVPVIMFNQNLVDDRLVPSCADWVNEHDRQERPVSATSGPSGYKVLEGKKLDMSVVVPGVMEAGFTPVRLRAIRRERGIRLALVCVRDDQVSATETVLSGRQLREIEEKIFISNLLDSRIFRNPGEGGGNFIVDSGNPSPTGKQKPRGRLEVVDGQFILTDIFEVVEATQRSIGASISEL